MSKNKKSNAKNKPPANSTWKKKPVVITLASILLLGAGVGIGVSTLSDTDNTKTGIQIPTKNTLTKAEITAIKENKLPEDDSATLTRYVDGEKVYAGDTKGDTEYTKSTNTTSANSETDYGEINFTELTGKSITQTDINSVLGTKKYRDYVSANKQYTRTNYDIKEHLAAKFKDNLPVYTDNEVPYEEMLEQKENSYFVLAYSPTCLYTNAFLKDTLNYYVDATKSLKVYSVNLDIIENKEMLTKYNVVGTPSMLYIKDGKVQKITTGVVSFGYLFNFEQNLEKK